jgi:FemAB-related protein (PEP-CTERM system-associated)
MRAPFLVARPQAGASICGVLPLFAVSGPMQGHLSNGLFGAYGPVLADDPFTHRALIRKSEELFEQEGLAYLMLKCLEDGNDSGFREFERVDNWVIATLPLEADSEKLWAGFRDKIRNCVRKAQRFGLEVRWGRDQLDGYYDVLAENMHRKGSPIYGLEFMRELVDAMGDRAEIVTLRQGEQVVSGALLLYHRDTASVPFASSRPSTFHMCPNNLLYWEMIRRSCEKGMKTFDFGRSIQNSSPLAFKIGWGAKVVAQPTYVFSAPGKSPKLSPEDPVVDFFVRQWQRLPRRVADALGPAICRRWLA